jgi:tetratricopeptide (TPR) repeat protein
VLAAPAILLLLCAGIAGTSWGLVRAERARQAEADQRALAEAALVSERAAKEAEAEQRNRATEAARKATREAATATAIVDFLNNDLLGLSAPGGQAARGVSPDANLRIRTVLQRAAKRIDGKFPNDSEVEMKLRHTIGYALSDSGDHAAALPQYEKLAVLSRKLLGPDDAYTLNAEYRVASMHRGLRHFDIALPLLEENVERQKAVLGEGHRQTLVAMSGLSISYGYARQTDKALRLAEQTLELRKRHLGPTDRDTLVSINNVAWLYQEHQRLDKAVPLYEAALAGMRTKFPPLHPERLNTTANLARAYYLAEEIDKAVPLQESVLPQYRTAHGVDDARTLFVFNSLLSYYADAGWCDKLEALLNSTQSGGANRRTNANPGQDQREKRYRELIQRMRPAAEQYRQELAAKKADHPDTLAARQAFAVALRGQKRTTGAAYHLKAVLDARERLFGADHPDTRATRLELGVTRLQQKRYAEAVPLLLGTFAGPNQHESTTPESKIGPAEGLRRLVQLYDSWNKKDKADEGRQKLDEQTKP